MRKLLVLSCLILAIFLVAPTYTVDGQGSISFSTADIKLYQSSLNTFRQALRSNRPKVFDYFLLRARGDVVGKDRFKEISLTNSKGVTVWLAIDVINIYVLGYCTPNPSCRRSYFFNDADARVAMSYVFQNCSSTILPFDGSYGQLAKEGGSRRKLHLGLPTLSNLIPALYNCRNPNDRNYTLVAQALVVAVQAISEAARFKIIQDAVPRDAKPTEQVLTLENNWSTLSKAVQEADPITKRFRTNVTLFDEKDAQVVVYNVDQPIVRRNLKLLLNFQGAQATAELLGHENYAAI